MRHLKSFLLVGLTMTFKSRRGYAMVEAAIIFPLTVLVIVVLIFSLSTLYMHVYSSSALHLMLDTRAGEYSETFYISPEVDEDIRFDEGISKVTGEVSYEYMTGGLLLYRSPETKEDSCHVLNEKRHMRLSDNVRD